MGKEYFVFVIHRTEENRANNGEAGTTKNPRRTRWLSNQMEKV